MRLSHVPIVEDKSRVRNAETIDGNPVTTNTSANASGGDASGPSERDDRSFRTEVLDNEEPSLEIKLEDKIVVDGGVVRKAMDLGMSSQFGDMIWVTFDSSTKEVIKIYE